MFRLNVKPNGDEKMEPINVTLVKAETTPNGVTVVEVDGLSEHGYHIEWWTNGVKVASLQGYPVGYHRLSLLERVISGSKEAYTAFNVVRETMFGDKVFDLQDLREAGGEMDIDGEDEVTYHVSLE